MVSNCSYSSCSADYQGLTQGFRHGKIFCSTITARLVKLRLGVPTDLIQAVPLNETVLIDGVRVTFIDANHCPGAVMILFEPPNGKVRGCGICLCSNCRSLFSHLLSKWLCIARWGVEVLRCLSEHAINHVLLWYISTGSLELGWQFKNGQLR